MVIICITSFFSENVLRKKQLEEETRGVKRKLERDIELEEGDDYILNLKKNYDLPEAYKYDNIPEIWEGHNIADFIDPEILKVRIKLFAFFFYFKRFDTK